jgi:aryl-phospho-beta-D-glucosidase BglC (GH1 family)
LPTHRIASRLLIALSLCFLIIVPSFSQQASDADNKLAFERASHLRRGINASIWFAQSTRDYSPQRLTTYITADDFKLIHQLGFDHVRLSIDPAPLLKAPLTDGMNADHLKLLDGAVKEILDNHLNVVLDIHPEGAYKHPLRTDKDAQDAFVQFWSIFATHYATQFPGSDPEHMFFEILNEPEVNDPAVWANLQGQVVPVIRKAAPAYTIVATAAHYSGLRDLLQFQPVSDRNVIYTFHDYEPFPFTHQGAGWTMDEVKHLSQIPYPSTPENIAPKLSEEQTLADQYWLNEYGLDQWNAARIASNISFARKWGEQYHVPVWCGEFGVFRDHSDPAMRAQWTHDMRVALEQNGIGWNMWDWRNNFGLATDVNGKRVADPEMVKALGLNPVQ